MKRVNGFLDLDEYFKEVKKEEKITDLGLSVKKYVTKSDYKRGHYWLKINGEFYYFKQSDSIYEEVIVSECAKFLGMDAVSYDLAIYKDVEGVISKSYRKNNATYIGGIDILYDYLNEYDNFKYLKEMGYDNSFKEAMSGGIVEAKELNNLEIIWQALEYRYQGKNVDIESIINQIVHLFIFNILVAQHDGEPQNWEIEESVDGIKLMPFIDAELCFQNPKYLLNPRGSMATSFNDQDFTNYEHLKEFFRISSEEYIDLFLDKFEMFTLEAFEDIIKQVEEKIGKTLPVMTKHRIISSFQNNREKIEVIIEEMQIKRKGVNLDG